MSFGPRRGRLAVGLAAAALAFGAAPVLPQAAAPQEPPPPRQIFPAQIEQVVVDVVVADKHGEPVVDLKKSDFMVTDEGQPQTLTSFELVTQRDAPPAGATTPRPSAVPVVTNVGLAAEHGRTFVVVFDDLHMSPLNARRAKAAVAAFLEKGAAEGDRALLCATSGSAWWGTRLGAGRQDLLAVLKHLEGRRIPDNAFERLTDFEAVRIAVYQDAPVAARVAERLDRYGTQSKQAAQDARDRNPGGQAGMIDPYVQMRASETYVKLRARLDVTLAVLDRCLKTLQDTRDRKAVLLVSEGFVDDPSNDGFKRVREAARRANAAVYFIDTRGLRTLGDAYSAEFGASFAERDLLSAIADLSYDGDGAANLAADTGGFAVRNNNDFAAGAVRIGRESRSYYLLGYSPGEIPQDGRFRKIDVHVRGRELVVRARRGYYAKGGAADTAAAIPKGERRDPEMQRALDSPAAADAIPLRMTAYALENAGSDKVELLLTADADVRTLAASEGGNAALDTLAVIAHRDTGEFERSDQRVELQRRPGAAQSQPIWYSMKRQFEVGAGGYQAKLVVRDPVSRRVGSVILEFDVPPLDRLRVSTPILTDTLLRSEDGVLSPALLARRSFANTGSLYCRFDVFGAAKGPDGMPRVKAGHALRRPAGAMVGRTLPNWINPTSIGALSRMIQIPLAGMAPGDYELVINVSDEVTGEAREIVEPLSLRAANAAPGS